VSTLHACISALGTEVYAKRTSVLRTWYVRRILRTYIALFCMLRRRGVLQDISFDRAFRLCRRGEHRRDCFSRRGPRLGVIPVMRLKVRHFFREQIVKMQYCLSCHRTRIRNDGFKVLRLAATPSDLEIAGGSGAAPVVGGGARGARMVWGLSIRPSGDPLAPDSRKQRLHPRALPRCWLARPRPKTQPQGASQKNTPCRKINWSGRAGAGQLLFGRDGS